MTNAVWYGSISRGKGEPFSVGAAPRAEPQEAGASVAPAFRRVLERDEPMSLVAFENKLSDLSTVNHSIGEISPVWSEREENNGIVNRSLTWIVLPDGRKLEVTDRFLKSLAARFHVSAAFFKYFKPDEVFARLQEVHPRTRVRLMIDKGRALAMSNPAKPFVQPEDLCRLLREQGDRVADVQYHNGVVTSTHTMDEAEWTVGKDAFKQTFTLETPIDGLGLPSVYLSLIRQICTNGMVGYAPAFRSSITIGKDDQDNPLLPLSRAMDCFNNDEGFDALRQRLDAALLSEASVYEVRMLAKAIHNDLAGKREDQVRYDDVFSALGELTGDVALKYQVASEEAISRKRQSMLAMNCTVYDLLNFATEIVSHYGDLLSRGATKTIAWVGQTLAQEYDLERSLETVDDESEDTGEIRRRDLRDREAPAFHLDGKLRNVRMIHAISGDAMPDMPEVAAERLADGGWDPDDADLDV